MSKPTSYDVGVNHSVVFKCGEHNQLLVGTPRLEASTYPIGNPEIHWMFDTSDMWCEHESVEDQDEQDCVDSWRITVDALEVAP